MTDQSIEVENEFESLSKDVVWLEKINWKVETELRILDDEFDELV